MTSEPFEPRPAVTCLPDETIREIGDRFIQSAVPVLVVVNPADGMVRGIITLHDLIRAQAAVRQ
ncbi:MAG: CBS domain-containing protein [Acidobacteriota bacterium]|nr:CBS domain-containing protein [Acidobacteriota bacterium]